MLHSTQGGFTELKPLYIPRGYLPLYANTPHLVKDDDI